MGGLGILIVIVLYVAIAIFVVRKMSTRWGKAIAALFAVLLPTGDALWGRYVTLPRLCQDAGLKVFKKVSKEDGLMFDGTGDDYWITKYGIAFVEGRNLNEAYRRRISDGHPVLERNVQPRAKYIFKTIPINQYTNFGGSEDRIEDRITGEVVTRYRTYGYGGGWAERFLGGFADSGPQTDAGCRLKVLRPMDALIQITFE